MSGGKSPGSPEVVAALVQRHGRALVLYARQWCDEPEDVVQEAFLKLVQQRTMPDCPVAWLFRVVRREAASAARSSRRRRRREERVSARGEPWFEQASGDGLDAEAATVAMRGLRPELREVVAARLWGGLSFDQIARLAGCSTSTAHRRYQAALEQLRMRLSVPCLEKSRTKVKVSGG